MGQNVQRKTDKGFTLVELMLVVVIIGLLAGVAVPNLMGRLKEAKRAKASADVKVLENAIDMYAMHIGNYPTTEQGLNVLVSNVGNQDDWSGPYLKKGKKIPKDPWKNDYVYRADSQHDLDYDLFSKGPDEQEDTDDDIGNWIKDEEE